MKTQLKRPVTRSPHRLIVVVVALAALTAATVWSVARHQEEAVSAGPRHGWIFHEQDEITVVRYPGAGHYSDLVTERWVLTKAPYTSRELTYPSFASPRIEVARSGGDSFFFDAKTDSLFQADGTGTLAFHDPATEYRHEFHEHLWKLAGHEQRDGRKALRLVRQGIPSTTLVVDARTFRPLELTTPGFPLLQRGVPRKDGCTVFRTPETPPSKTLIRVRIYEYLPPTTRNKRLLAIRGQHPHATVKPASAMSESLKAQFKSRCGSKPQTPLAQ